MSEMSCRGWWEQSGYGRQDMQSLEVSFVDQRLQGAGFDIVGHFTLDGILEDGKIVLNKQYTGRHRVIYIGTYDGEGTFSGRWKLGGDSGTWMIRIEKAKSKQVVNAHEIPLFQPN